MLSEVVIAGTKAQNDEANAKRTRKAGLSCSGLFPCPHYLYLAHKGTLPKRDISGESYLNMNNGWVQEEESVKILAKQGIEIKNRQGTVRIGKAGIPGHIDGEVWLRSRMGLWEHKAWAGQRVGVFRAKGFDAYPGEKAQINFYMLGRNLDCCDFYVKDKENNVPYDVVVERDQEFTKDLLGWVDEIVLGDWEPGPKDCKHCSRCWISSDCWGVEVLDLSGYGALDDTDLAEKWKDGKKYRDVGQWMMDAAKTEMVEKYVAAGFGPGDNLFIENVRVRLTPKSVWRFDKEMFIGKFSALDLLEVGEEHDESFYAVREVNHE